MNKRFDHQNYNLNPKPLGRGGQAEVFAALDKKSGLRVAIKPGMG
jgi:hypothetical protein